MQDLAGYDLEFMKLLLNTNSIVKMAGDPRQVTYHTHFSTKYKKYDAGRIQDFILNECKNMNCLIDTATLNGSWRNHQKICDFANKLFPEYPQCKSLQQEITEHNGVFLYKEKDIKKYMQAYEPLQLRYDRKNKKINSDYDVKNFGESKGATYERIIIYPTKKMLEWILTNTPINTFEIKCKFYVAITRAKFSVAIVCKNSIDTDALPIYQCK